MAKKKTVKKKRKLTSEERHVMTLIDYTERAITNQGTSLDEFFTQQANRLRLRLEDLKGK